MTLKKISRIAVFSALCIALRLAFGLFPNIKPITAIFLSYTLFYGLGEGLLVMVMTMLITSSVLGFGPWVLGQFISYAAALCFWFFLYHPALRRIKAAGKKQLLESLGAGLVALIYGIMIDTYSAVLFGSPVWPMLISGLYFNLAHCLSTVLFYPLITTIFRRFTTYEENL